MKTSHSWKVSVAMNIPCLVQQLLLFTVYSKKLQATTHIPDKVLDLKKCKYVGVKIPVRALGPNETFEFDVSIENCDVVTFAAKSW